MIKLKKFKKETIINRRTATEAANSNHLQGNFDAGNSKGLDLLRSITDDNLTKKSILTVCLALSGLIKKPLLRDYKRRKTLLIKWIDDNYEQCALYMPYLSFELIPK